jgi:hypothetical protein
MCASIGSSSDHSPPSTEIELLRRQPFGLQIAERIQSIQ